MRNLFSAILVSVILFGCVVTPKDLPELYKKNIHSVVSIHVDKYDAYTNKRIVSLGGSGFIVDKTKGLILTAAHVVNRHKIFRVQLYSGIVIGAEIVAVDPINDLALLRADPRLIDYSVLPLQLELNPVIGEYIFSIGSPSGYVGTVSFGILSRDLIFIDFFSTEVYLSDLHIYDGNSGCPVFNLESKLIGMVVGYAGGGILSAIIPATSIEKFLNDNK